jgi:hypothetical protein
MNAVILENGHVHSCERRIEVAEKDEETLSAFSKIDTWSFENRHVEFRKSTRGFSKINIRETSRNSSTEAKTVGAGNFLPQTIWTRNFVEAQGCKTTNNDSCQDNMSAMKLEKNGISSAGQRSCHINI